MMMENHFQYVVLSAFDSFSEDNEEWLTDWIVQWLTLNEVYHVDIDRFDLKQGKAVSVFVSFDVRKLSTQNLETHDGLIAELREISDHVVMCLNLRSEDPRDR